MGGRFRNQIRTKGFAIMADLLTPRKDNVLSDLFISKINMRDAGILAFTEAFYRNISFQVDDLGNDVNREVNLRVLDLEYNVISSKGFVPFFDKCLANMPNLQQLLLGGNRLENKAIVHLAKILKEICVTRLSLKDNGITSKGLVSFLNIVRSNRNLTHMDLSENNFSDYETGFKLSVESYFDSNLTLESINLSNCKLEKDFFVELGHGIKKN
jgi:hypothetical protein